MKSGKEYSRMRKLLLIIFTCALLAGLNAGNVFAGLVDWGSFTASPGSLVTIDESSATLREDSPTDPEHALIAPVSLENYQFLIPSTALAFSFTYDLLVPESNIDYFDFYFGDTTAPYFSAGGQVNHYSGTVNITDLSSYRGTEVAIIFGLMCGEGDYGYESSLTISNVQINEALPPNPVPEPATLLLFGSSLAVIGLFRKRG